MRNYKRKVAVLLQEWMDDLESTLPMQSSPKFLEKKSLNTLLKIGVIGSMTILLSEIEE